MGIIETKERLTQFCEMMGMEIPEEDIFKSTEEYIEELRYVAARAIAAYTHSSPLMGGL